MRNEGLGSWLARRRRIAPDRPALRFEGATWTYADLDQRVMELARGFADLGLQRGDRVAYLGPNHPAFLETLFAAGALGAVFVPVNFRLAVEDVAYILDDSGATLVVHHPAVAELVATLRSGDPVWTSIPTAPDGEGQVAYEALIADHAGGTIDVQVDPADVCMLPYTSGTTGRPKGVMLTHANLTANVHNFQAVADFSSRDTTLAFAPLFRVGGLAITVLPTMWKGGSVLLMPGPDPDRALELIATERVTTMFASPDLLAGLVRSPGWAAADLRSVRFCLTGGAPVPETLIRAFLDRGVPCIQGYGLTETSPLALILDPADMLRKVGSAGRPPFYTDVRIVRPDMTDVVAGEVGEVVVRGPNVMLGYWNQPEATSAALTDGGWFHTGDAARSDPEGFVEIVDRITDVVTTAGGQVYPAETERVLREHPAVHEVGVVGVPEEANGEALVAFVVTADTITDVELVAWATNRLDAFKVPRHVFFVDALPRNPAGKMLRGKLRAMALQAD